MSQKDEPRLPGRRQFLTSAGLIAAAAGSASRAAAAIPSSAPGPMSDLTVPFWGKHQAGIATRQQKYIYFAAFDLYTTRRENLEALMRSWTTAASRMTQGQTADVMSQDGTQVPSDSGEALGLAPHRLTLTFGFGPGLFIKDGVDRFGLAQRRPEALIDLPRFSGDQLVPERTGGDLCVQACADDPLVAFHAVRQLARLAYDSAKIRWAQNGFLSGDRSKETPRNLMGFKDGTMNVPSGDPAALDRLVWIGDEGGWMRHGSYLVARPIRVALEHWDRMKLGFQEQVVGRHKFSGAPLGGKQESEPMNLEATDADGNLLIPESAHVRLAAPASNDGAQILRRGYSFDNGLSFTAERWPPWHQGMEFDAGLLFLCYQRDPRTGFVKIFENMSKFDMMNQFATHVGGGLFACPAGTWENEYIGQSLFETA